MRFQIPLRKLTHNPQRQAILHRPLNALAHLQHKKQKCDRQAAPLTTQNSMEPTNGLEPLTC